MYTLKYKLINLANKLLHKNNKLKFVYRRKRDEGLMLLNTLANCFDKLERFYILKYFYFILIFPNKAGVYPSNAPYQKFKILE